MTFGTILKELLEHHEITQKQLAEALNLAPTTIGNYIRGEREPDFEILKMLATYFHVSTDYLLNYHPYVTQDHREDELLYLFRSLPEEYKRIYLVQGKGLAQSHNDGKKK